MKDQRLTFFRNTFEALVESLDATVRLARWSDSPEAIPEPLRQSATQLLDRLGTANRLATGKFQGSPTVVASMTAIAAAIARLDAAFVQYRKITETAPSQKDEAAIALDSEIGNVKADAEKWAP